MLYLSAIPDNCAPTAVRGACSTRNPALSLSRSLTLSLSLLFLLRFTQATERSRTHTKRNISTVHSPLYRDRVLRACEHAIKIGLRASFTVK